jgi:hypothetical protein
MGFEENCIMFWRIADEVQKECPTMKHLNIKWLTERLVENETLEGAYNRIVLKQA